ncbi:DUF2889 domain-containing protein [Marinobacter sp. 71-i]|uniref:DUF2889 domain-containing protein n=1 Tax=Marinobacter iranensis TaxID=2962607 RepID=A0ABT5YAX1_9GAMM|nr:DUF2889 domain-containing protein [Marinobacter iranensis]MDF0750828.1 DUF2889 domain-containing protein [Marinobacter iranensis]
MKEIDVPLPPAEKRKLLHTRRVIYRGYEREDGLWDIEGELLDTKTHPLTIPNERTLQIGEPIHGMLIRVTINAEMVVHGIDVAMNNVPHGPCRQAMAPMQLMIGSKMGPGWRKAIEHHLGEIKGCVHLRELLFNMATAAFQTLPAQHTTVSVDPNRPPQHLGKCVTWDFNGPLVQNLYPVYFQHEIK